MTTLKARQTNCTLCSLACALGFDSTPFGRIQPAYPGETRELRHGICGRGHLNYELVDHPLRLEQPLVRRNDRLLPTPLAEVAQRLATKLATEPTLVMIDGSLPVEDIAAAASLTRLLGRNAVFSVYMDPGDIGGLMGIAASGAAILTPERLAYCDAVLCIGDAFGSHPVISRAVHAISRRNPRRLFAVIDSVASRTARFSNRFLQIRPGSTSLVLQHLAGEDVSAAQAAAKADIAEADLSTLAASLKKTNKLAVLVSCAFGRDQDPEAVGLLAGKIAAKTSGGVVPLPLLGNAWGALGAAKALQAVPNGNALEQLASGQFKNVLLLGINPAVETPFKGVSEALGTASTLIIATYLKPGASELGHAFLPLAAPVETSGTLVNGSGEVVALDAVVNPPAGALTVRQIAQAFAEPLSQGPAISTSAQPAWLEPAAVSPVACLETEVVLVEPRTGDLVAGGEAGCVHLGSGALSTRLAWPNVFENLPDIRISTEDASHRGLTNDQEVTVTSSNGTARMRLKLDHAMKPGRAALLVTSPAVRPLFNWRKSTDGRLTSGPVAIRIGPS